MLTDCFHWFEAPGDRALAGSAEKVSDRPGKSGGRTWSADTCNWPLAVVPVAPSVSGHPPDGSGGGFLSGPLGR